jgi:hypothetical protein
LLELTNCSIQLLFCSAIGPDTLLHELLEDRQSLSDVLLVLSGHIPHTLQFFTQSLHLRTQGFVLSLCPTPLTDVILPSLQFSHPPIELTDECRKSLDFTRHLRCCRLSGTHVTDLGTQVRPSPLISILHCS